MGRLMPSARSDVPADAAEVGVGRRWLHALAATGATHGRTFTGPLLMSAMASLATPWTIEALPVIAEFSGPACSESLFRLCARC